jgi:hypothetical protein
MTVLTSTSRNLPDLVPKPLQSSSSWSRDAGKTNDPYEMTKDDRVFLLHYNSALRHEDVWEVQPYLGTGWSISFTPLPLYTQGQISRPSDSRLGISKGCGKDKLCCPVNNRYVIVITAPSKVMVCSVQGFTSLVVDKKKTAFSICPFIWGAVPYQWSASSCRLVLQGTRELLRPIFSADAAASWTGWPWELKSFFLLLLLFLLRFLYKKLPT